MKTKNKFFGCNCDYENSYAFSQVNGKRYRYSIVPVFCKWICYLVFAFSLLALLIGGDQTPAQKSPLFQVYISGGLVVVLSIFSMLFGKTRMVISKEAIYTPSETIFFRDIEGIDLWPSWWRYEYWLRHMTRHPQYFFNSFLCIKMKNGSKKVVINNYICRNIVEINKYVPTNLTLIFIREILKDCILLGLVMGIVVVFGYVGVGDKYNFAFFIYLYFSICNINFLLHHLWSMFLSKHFLKEYGIGVQENGTDIAVLIFFGSAVLVSIMIYFSFLR